MNPIKLSILVLTVPNRITTFFPHLIRELESQTENRTDVEILALYDNKKRSVGLKRQALLHIAKGEYLVFIDDDDEVAEDYVELIMKSLYDNPETDCVVFDCIQSTDDIDKLYCRYGIEFEYEIKGNQWTGKPAHTMVYRSSIAKAHPYHDMVYAEDTNWVKRACVDIKHQTRIDKVLYYYKFNNNVSETSQNL